MNSSKNTLEEIQSITCKSEFLDHLRCYAAETKSLVFGDDIRHLTQIEISELQRQGNRAENWRSVLVTKDFTSENIYQNEFRGECVLGRFTGKALKVEPYGSLPSGIYYSTVCDSEIGSDSLVYRVSMLRGYCIEKNCTLYDCRAVVFAPTSKMGNGIELALGNENECRSVSGFAEMTVSIARSMALDAEKESRQRCRRFITHYTDKCEISKGIISSGASIRYGATVRDSYIGSHAVIDRAEIVNCTVLSSITEPVFIGGDGKVRNSCVQWGSTIDSFGYVDSSILCEHSHVEKHGKVHSSIIGPNTGIAEGEVTSGLLGPFIGFHHQALLIAALWPEGKGNVGYGANIGSNHTGKAPDQEIICGEGLFFGLGVNIKYPSNFADSPYTIIATGVNTLPQKVSFPFSLINKPVSIHEGISPAFNEIYPGWMLSDNIFAIMRNETKYRKRNKASRAVIHFDVFRPEIVSRMLDARKRLENIAEKKELYLEKDIAGLGKNFLTEKNRTKAISTYTFFIEYYVLRGVYQRAEILLQKQGSITKGDLYDEQPLHGYWAHQHTLLHRCGVPDQSIEENLLRFCEIVRSIAQKTENAKTKDDGRGRKIIEDYHLYHSSASEDAFVKTMHATAETVAKRAKELIRAAVE